MHDTFDTNAPPPLPPPPGHKYYLPEPYYFFHEAAIPVHVVVRTVAYCVARWCDRYVVPGEVRTRPNGSRSQWPGRSGAIPAETCAQRRTLDDLFKWLDDSRGEPFYQVDLARGDLGIFVQDGALFFLVLTPTQFSELQECLQAQGLPPDLFYPADEQHEIEEDVQIGDSVVRMKQKYSPKRWALRATQQSVSEIDKAGNGRDQDIRRFLEACNQFAGALSLRELQIRLRSDQSEQEELDLLRPLSLALGRTIAYIGSHTATRDVRDLDR
jgi:hypothetical protein